MYLTRHRLVQGIISPGWVVGLLLSLSCVALAGCGGRFDKVDQGSGGSGADGSAGGGGSAQQAGGSSSGSSSSGNGGTGGSCAASTPLPPMKEVDATHSLDAFPSATGGEIPVPSSFVLTALRVKANSLVVLGGERAFRFVSATEVEYGTKDGWGAYRRDVREPTNLYLSGICKGGVLNFDYSYANGVLIVFDYSQKYPLMYTYTQVKE
jgi:hypothetical protein